MHFQQVTASALEIDFGTLAASLNCVPLHKRLDISADGVHVCILNSVRISCCYQSHGQTIIIIVRVTVVRTDLLIMWSHRGFMICFICVEMTGSNRLWREPCAMDL